MAAWSDAAWTGRVPRPKGDGPRRSQGRPSTKCGTSDGNMAVGAPMRPDRDRMNQWCETWKQATSYWETALPLFAFKDAAPLPA
jgi:hypothetical protein